MSLQMSLLDLLGETDQITDWYMLGMYLKLPRGRLTEIERQFSGHGATRCKLEMFDLWMNLNPDASWEMIVLALEKFGKTALAEHIRGQHPPVAPSEVGPATREPESVTIRLEKEKVKHFRTLEKEFAIITTDLKTVLEEKVSLTKLARFLMELLDEDEKSCEKLLQAASIDKLFLLIKPHYSFLSIGILEDIIDKFVGEPLKQQLKQYEEQLNEFAETTKMSLLQKLQSQRPSCATNPPAVVFKLNGAWPSVTIKHFDKFVNQIFEENSRNFSHIQVKSGCICVSWFARRSAIPGLVVLAQQKVEFMRHVGVLKLRVGDNIILEQEKKEEEEDNDLHSLLLRATTADCAQAVEFLLSIGTDPDCTSENGDTPLIIACRNESTSIVNMFLTARANVNFQNKQGYTALIVVCCAEVPNENLVRMLVQAGAEVNIPSGKIQVSLPNEAVVMTHVTALTLAARRGHTNIVQYLLNEGADVNTLDTHGSSALTYASSHGHTETVRLLLNYGANVNMQMTADGCTALMLACRGHIDTVHLLLSHDATVNTQDKYGTTALMIASRLGFPEIVHFLLSYGADVSIQDGGNGTALHCACVQQRTVCVELLLTNGADPNIQDANGYTPLMLTSSIGAIDRDQMDPTILVMLLSVGANPNIQAEDGSTALMFAVATSYQEGVVNLLNAGASVNLQDSNGYTALHDAAKNGNLEIVELLLGSGAQASVSAGVTPLDLALNGGHDDVCQLLITSMESDPLTSQQLEHRQPEMFQESSNPAPPTTQDTHSSEHPQHQPNRSAVQTTRTRLHHARRSLSTMHHYFENILLPDRAIKHRDEADNNSKQDSNTSKFNN